MAYLFKLKAGTYQLRWKEGSKVKSKTFRTWAEAKMLLKDIESQPQLSAYLETNMIAAEYLVNHLRTMRDRKKN